MRAVIQRVSSASVTVNGGAPRPIGPGLAILLGVKDGEDTAIIPKLAAKCANLRIFEDDAGKLNRSAAELGLSALVVSNFTLYGDTSRGNRPSFIRAAKGEAANAAYETFLKELSAQGLRQVAHGVIRRRYAADLNQRRPCYHRHRHRRLGEKIRRQPWNCCTSPAPGRCTPTPFCCFRAMAAPPS